MMSLTSKGIWAFPFECFRLCISFLSAIKMIILKFQKFGTSWTKFFNQPNVSFWYHDIWENFVIPIDKDFKKWSYKLWFAQISNMSGFKNQKHEDSHYMWKQCIIFKHLLTNLKKINGTLSKRIFYEIEILLYESFFLFCIKFI